MRVLTKKEKIIYEHVMSMADIKKVKLKPVPPPDDFENIRVCDLE